MQELSIASHLLEAVRGQVEQHGARRVTAINLLVGERAGIVEGSLRFCFDLLAPDTPAEGAVLNLRKAPMVFHCGPCAADYSPSAAELTCPSCGEYGELVD